MANEWKQIGTVLKSKDANKGNYIKIKESVSLQAGDIVQIRDPRKSLDEAVAAGRMSEDKAESIKAKIPEYVLKELVLAPRR